MAFSRIAPSPALVLVLALLHARPAPAAPKTCADEDYDCLQTAVNHHPTRNLAHWSKGFSLPLEERIHSAPPELVEAIHLDNRLNDYPEVPRAAAPPEDFLTDVRTALRGIPESVKKLAAPRVAGIFLIEDLGTTGLTQSLRDERGRTVASYVVLDSGVLGGKKANEWATWKERTPFESDGIHELEAVIEKPEDSTRANAIQYILLHELGHAVNHGIGVHPWWDDRGQLVTDPGKFPFLALSWTYSANEQRYSSVHDRGALRDRGDIVYYSARPRLKAARAADLYERLERTDFPTLYAAVRPDDDWAESFVTYVHVVLMKKPFRVEIRKGGKPVKTFTSCWGTPRCAKKEAFLARLLGK